ncbi:EAL domain-containing protein [Vibrio olivae]|uniref:cyclic-guanylate-specific phosphodiesterase n=1 Tax=Vibrio olivae TaxID=1243002 RepID=A0ABV5HR98_9VIBR
MTKPNLSKMIIALMIAVILFVIANVVTRYVQREAQHAFTQELLHHSDLVTNELAISLNQVIKAGLNQCDEATIDKLRVISNRYSYVYDVGLVRNNQILCTANWGKMKQASRLPKPDEFHSKSGPYVLYSNVSDLFPTDITLHISRLADALVFVPVDVHGKFLDRKKPFSFSIRAETGRYTMLEYQATNQQSWLSSKLFDFMALKTRSCSKIYAYCAESHSNRTGLFYYGNLIPAASFLAFLLLGFVVYYGVESIIYRKRSMEFRLTKAVSERSLYMEYQPLLCAATKKIVGVEGLIRWHDDAYGRVSPELFISLAEKIALYPQVAHFTADCSVKEMASVLVADRSFTLSININTYEILNPEYLDVLKGIALKNDVHAQQIKIEITERIEVSLQELSEFSQRAKRYGFRVSLDDFGTGVSNLVWLTEIDFDEIKVDRVFTQALNSDFKQALVMPIMDLVSGLNKQVVFEGVENKVEYDLIVNTNPSAIVQGWYFYKSMPKAQLLSHLS